MNLISYYDYFNVPLAVRLYVGYPPDYMRMVYRSVADSRSDSSVSTFIDLFSATDLVSPLEERRPWEILSSSVR
jgi:hypothetical protein